MIELLDLFMMTLLVFKKNLKLIYLLYILEYIEGIMAIEVF